MAEFDEDIQKDLDDWNPYALALVAQDLRNTLKHVSNRAYIAALKRKQAEEARK